MSWKAKKQSLMSRSLAEVEHRAMVATVDELIRLTQFLGTLAFQFLPQLFFFTTIRQLFILQPIQFFMSVPNT